MYHNNLFESLIVAEIMLHTMNTNHSLDRLPGGCGNSERMVTEMAVAINKMYFFLCALFYSAKPTHQDHFFGKLS